MYLFIYNQQKRIVGKSDSTNNDNIHFFLERESFVKLAKLDKTVDI